MATMIEFIEVRIEPWRFPNFDQPVLKIRVRVDGEEYHSQAVIGPDDLHSYFDRTFDLAKEEIKKRILETEAIPDQQEPAEAR